MEFIEIKNQAEKLLMSLNSVDNETIDKIIEETNKLVKKANLTINTHKIKASIIPVTTKDYEELSIKAPSTLIEKIDAAKKPLNRIITEYEVNHSNQLENQIEYRLTKHLWWIGIIKRESNLSYSIDEYIKSIAFKKPITDKEIDAYYKRASYSNESLVFRILLIIEPIWLVTTLVVMILLFTAWETKKADVYLLSSIAVNTLASYCMFILHQKRKAALNDALKKSNELERIRQNLVSHLTHFYYTGVLPFKGTGTYNTGEEPVQLEFTKSSLEYLKRMNKDLNLQILPELIQIEEKYYNPIE